MLNAMRESTDYNYYSLSVYYSAYKYYIIVYLSKVF